MSSRGSNFKYEIVIDIHQVIMTRRDLIVPQGVIKLLKDY
jgi:hypothetical protein